MDGCKFDLFISYSHRADRRLAPVLKSAVQRLAKPFYRMRARSAYLDQTNLEASPELWPVIERALGDSRYFLLLASPAAAASAWVTREIEWWLAHRSPSALLIGWTAGELAWDADQHDFDWSRTTAIPRRLSGAFREEPFWLDLRWAVTADHVTPSLPRLRETIAPLVARADGVDLDLLVSADAKQHRRFRQAVTAVGIVLLGLTVAAVWFAISFLAQRNEAISRLARLYTANGVQSLEQKDQPGTLVWFSEALTLLPDQPREARIRLAAFLSEYPKPAQMFLGDAPVRFAGCSGDGARVVTIHTDNTVRVWNTATGKPVTPPLRHVSVVSSAAFSPNGRRLVTVCLRATPEATAADMATPSTRGLPSAAAAEQAAKEDAQQRKREPLLTDDEALAAFLKRLMLADTEEKQRLLAGHPYLERLWHELGPTADLGYFQVWDTESGRALTKPTKEQFRVTGAQFAADGKQVLAWGDGAHLWNLDPLDGLTPVQPEGIGTPTSLEAAISPDGRRYALGGYEPHGAMFDARSGAQLFAFNPGTTSVASAAKLAFSHDGRWLASGDRQGVVGVWQAQTGDSGAQGLTLDGEVAALAFSPDDRMLLAATGSLHVGRFKVWNASTGKRITETQELPLPVTAAAFSPDGARFLVSTFDASSGRAETHIYETPVADAWIPTPTVKELTPPLAGLAFAAWCPDGRQILSVTGSGIARTWRVDPNPDMEDAPKDTRDFRDVFTVKREGGGARVLDPDGHSRGQAANDVDSVWEPAPIVSADGTRLAVVQRRSTTPPSIPSFMEIVSYEVRVWNVATGQPTGPSFASGTESIKSVSFDPSGTHVAVARENGSITVWETSAGREIEPQIMTPAPLVGAGFNPDGRLILSRGGPNGHETLRLWDAKTGQPATVPMRHPYVKHAAFSPDGRLIVSAGNDVIRVWLTDTGDPLSPPVEGANPRWARRGLRLLVDPIFSSEKTLWRATHKTPRVWNLRTADEPADRLRLLAQAIAARHLDRTGALVDLDIASMRRVWEALNAPTASPR